MTSPVWMANGLLGYDSETSGVDVFTDRLVTACVAYRSETDSGWTRDWLTNVDGQEIPQVAVDVHGITTAHAHANGQAVIDVAEDVREVLQESWAKGVPVVGFNVSFDLSLLNAELLRAGHRELSIDGPVIDPLVIDRALSRRRGSRKLADVCAYYNVRHTAAAPGEDETTAAGAHNATADTLATLRVLWRLGKVYPSITNLDAQVLHEQQVIWHAEWAESFEGYLRSVGKGDVIEREWPIRRAVAEAATA